MQPGRKCRLAAKRSNLTIELQERFLRQIFGFGRVRRHAQAERIHPPLMLIVESLERLSVPLLGFFDQLGFVRVAALLFFGSVKSPFPAALREMRLTIFPLYGLQVSVRPFGYRNRDYLGHQAPIQLPFDSSVARKDPKNRWTQP